MMEIKKDKASSIAGGIETIKTYACDLPDTPGVYRMLGAAGEVLYVGKAKALKKRVMSYTHFDRLPIRLQRMVALTRLMEFVHTNTEAEALLLEANLIKKHAPRYNILLRDDKSFPYILIAGDHDFPLIRKHRGARKQKGEYFGPFASAGDVNHTLAILQRAFMLRNCSDNYFAQRKRPCLQYHIKRCTAPCVGLVTEAQYAAQVQEARDFLKGNSRAVQERFAAEMQEASAAEDYELAADLRDRIRALTSIQARQGINLDGIKDADAIGLVQKGEHSCVQVFFFRGGQNFGNRSYFPRHDGEEEAEKVLEAFIGQFYADKPVPRDILLSHKPEDAALLEQALSSKAEGAVHLSVPVKGARRRLMDLVLSNAQAALERHLAEKQGEAENLENLARIFDLDEAPRRIEVYDNSHISGTNMVGAMIVAGAEGFQKNAYRKFNIREAEAGDDIGMMREVLQRRFMRALKDDPAGENWPDLVLVDGGQGQFNAAYAVLEECSILDSVVLVAIAKGPDRNAGRETFFMTGRKPFRLPEREPALHYLQRLRDEAHRFAIGTHRARRRKQIGLSPLDEIPGVGPGRKKALLYHFGSAKAVAGAGVEDLQKVEGVSRALAQAIYDHFH